MSKKIVLYVDANLELGQVVVEALKLDSYQVLLSPDTEDGIATAHQERPEVVVVDDEAPGDSFELIKRVRQRFPYQALLIVGSSLTPERREAYKKAGVHLFLAKPFTTPKLSEAIKSAYIASLRHE